MPLKDNTLKRYGKGRVFIETGTQKGNGIMKALDAGFQTIYSIELQVENIDITYNVPVIRNAVMSGRVRLLQGNSTEILPHVIKGIDEEVTFFLDAHTRTDTVIYRELEIIRTTSRLNTNTVIVDDIDVMGNENHRWGYTVNRNEVRRLIQRIKPEYSIKYVNGERTRDILVAEV